MVKSFAKDEIMKILYGSDESVGHLISLQLENNLYQAIFTYDEKLFRLIIAEETFDAELEGYKVDILCEEVFARNVLQTVFMTEEQVAEFDSTPFMATDEFQAQLQELAEAIHKNSVSKGFWEIPQSVPESIALAHSELSEALESARHGFPTDDHVPNYGAFETELADAIIRILDMAVANKVDIVGAMLAKMHYNTTRSYKHGKKF